MPKLELASVTLCAAASVNVAATLSAMRTSMEEIAFAESLLFTDSRSHGSGDGIRVIPTDKFNSSRDYSEFMIHELADHVQTPHCLVVQWDGFVLNANKWKPEFLQFDYIGAPWPQFDDGRDVGNGGFSLRSKRLLEACQEPQFRLEGPEDVAICRTNRDFLEEDNGICFADFDLAKSFAFERTQPDQPTFGFHGVFNMVEAIGTDNFWDVYRGLDDRTTVFVDYWKILRQLGVGRDSTSRRIQLTADRLGSLLGR